MLDARDRAGNRCTAVRRSCRAGSRWKRESEKGLRGACETSTTAAPPNSTCTCAVVARTATGVRVERVTYDGRSAAVAAAAEGEGLKRENTKT